ncbi:MAG TPA: RsmD family RNA methyltransferase, partial [Planctomycetota bacterium]|nr:RsmD family RNA methyltransferase [Planctomycetota bacterium]
MSLRVIGGEYRGRVLTTVRGFGTRPLLAQVREAVFNILGQDLTGQEVWDLFAGTGASGIEALSRGARRVAFVEKSNQALQVLRQNL